MEGLGKFKVLPLHGLAYYIESTILGYDIVQSAEYVK